MDAALAEPGLLPGVLHIVCNAAYATGSGLFNELLKAYLDIMSMPASRGVQAAADAAPSGASGAPSSRTAEPEQEASNTNVTAAALLVALLKACVTRQHVDYVGLLVSALNTLPPNSMPGA